MSNYFLFKVLWYFYYNMSQRGQGCFIDCTFCNSLALRLIFQWFNTRFRWVWRRDTQSGRHAWEVEAGWRGLVVSECHATSSRQQQDSNLVLTSAPGCQGNHQGLLMCSPQSAALAAATAAAAASAARRHGNPLHCCLPAFHSRRRTSPLCFPNESNYT